LYQKQYYQRPPTLIIEALNFYHSQSFMNYKQQKADFLDSLQPDDFRNGGSFNQLEMIFDELNDAFLQATINKKNPEEFITKALRHLFRENSLAIIKAIDLANSYVLHKTKK
jgi:hypothetical protein